MKAINKKVCTKTEARLIRVFDAEGILSIEYNKKILPALYSELAAQKENREHPGFYKLSVKAQDELNLHLGRI